MSASGPLFANVRFRVIENRCIHVKRSVSGKGQVGVRVGQELQPQDIIGNSEISSGFTVVEVAKKLGVSPSEIQRYLQRSVGSKIFKGELLASKKGLLGNKVITSPTDGLIESLDPQKGELKLRFLVQPMPITSGVFGIVDAVDKSSGEVLIKTLVTEVYGVLGTGNERSGVLALLSRQGELTNADKITPELESRIIVAGGLLYGEVLKKAVALGVHGIVCGGMNFSDLKSMVGSVNPTRRLGTDVGISLIVSEGLGPVGIGDDIYKVIAAHQGNFAFINGNIGRLILPSNRIDSILTLRKTALPQSKAPDIAPELSLNEIRAGQKVRVIWPPFFGMQGVVLEQDSNSTVLESGISTIMVTIQTPKQKIKVPFPNIEIIG